MTDNTGKDTRTLQQIAELTVTDDDVSANRMAAKHAAEALLHLPCLDIESGIDVSTQIADAISEILALVHELSLDQEEILDRARNIFDDTLQIASDALQNETDALWDAKKRKMELDQTTRHLPGNVHPEIPLTPAVHLPEAYDRCSPPLYGEDDGRCDDWEYLDRNMMIRKPGEWPRYSGL